MRITVTGATGGVGRRLVEMSREAGHAITVLSRDAARARDVLGDVEAHNWDPQAGPPPHAALAGSDAVVNLAGESVAQRWSEEAKRKIHDSRVLGTRHLVAGMAALPAEQRPGVLISGSAIGYYGDVHQPIDESAPKGEGFLTDIAAAWEAEATQAEALGTRVVRIRTGDVFMDGDGVLPVLAKLTKVGVMGPLGGGAQPFPWIHVDDEVGLILHAATTAAVSGPLNAVSPGIVTQRELATLLGRILHRPAFAPAPAFAVRLLRGEMADLILEGAHATPAIALQSGYAFRWPQAEPALRDAL